MQSAQPTPAFPAYRPAEPSCAVPEPYDFGGASRDAPQPNASDSLAGCQYFGPTDTQRGRGRRRRGISRPQASHLTDIFVPPKVVLWGAFMPTAVGHEASDACRSPGPPLFQRFAHLFVASIVHDSLREQSALPRPYFLFFAVSRHTPWSVTTGPGTCPVRPRVPARRTLRQSRCRVTH
jgi:hypothetical protein